MKEERKQIVWDALAALYVLIGLQVATQIFAWVFAKMKSWGEQDIAIDRIGVSVYSSMMEKFVKAFGFEYSAVNPAKGKVYVTRYSALAENAAYKKIMAKNGK